MTDTQRSGRYVGLTLELTYDHPLGALRAYFEALEQGRALAARCGACEQVWFPPRRVCCGKPIAQAWVTLDGSGTVLAVTRCRGAMPFTAERGLETLALVAFDGADNAAVGWMVDGDESIAPGSRVRLVARIDDAAHPVQCARFERLEE